MDSLSSQNKKNLLSMIKRSKSKETGGQSYRNQSSNQVIEEMKQFSQTMNVAGVSGEDQKGSSQHHQRTGQGSQGLNGASKSIFNASYKELKPSKSVDLSSFN